MSSNGLVTVAIPTRHRPDYLRLAIASVTSQDYRPLEIVIGDDSTDDRTATLAEELKGGLPAGCKIVYQHNVPPLGQAGNINALFRAASAPRLILLHDDDLLLPDAVSTLVEAMDAGSEVVAAYGFQRLCDDGGTDLGDAAAESLNRRYERTPDRVGPQADPAAAGILRQLPNDGYLISTALARRVGYRPESEVGSGCESDFGVRAGLAAPAGGFVLVAQDTCVYRKTASAMSSGGESGSAALFYEALRSTPVPASAEWAREKTLSALAPVAVRYLARRRQRKQAFDIWRSRHYKHRLSSTRGLFALLNILVPTADRLRRGLTRV